MVTTSSTESGIGMWQPARTHVLVVGITAWPPVAKLPASIGTRRDTDLVKQFKAAGVPHRNILFVKDRAATRAGLRKALQTIAARSGPEETLIFCFLGHGGRDSLYCYDFDDQRPDETTFRIETLGVRLAKDWKGSRLFLIGDFCSSGSLETVLRQFEKSRRDVRTAILASAMTSGFSTSGWTFTEGLIRIFGGDPLVDRDGDGLITMTDARCFLHDQMKYKENQLANVMLSANFEKKFVIRAVAAGISWPQMRGPFSVGDILEVRGEGNRWRAAEIVDLEPASEKYKVRRGDREQWVRSAQLRPIVKSKLRIGGRYEIKWEGKWYPASVTKAHEGYFYFIHYEDGTGEHDEWITAERARNCLRTSKSRRED